jgi:hypothetical protein
MTAISNTAPLNEAQLLLLKMFSSPMSEEHFNGLRHVLVEYYESLLHKELERVIEVKKITRTDFDALYNKDQRTKLA